MEEKMQPTEFIKLFKENGDTNHDKNQINLIYYHDHSNEKEI